MSCAALGPPEPALADAGAAIVLRPWRVGDLPALVVAWSDPAIAASCGVPPDAGPDRAEKWIAGWAQRADSGRALDLVVADVSTDQLLGEVGLWPFLAPPNDALVRGALELGWWTGAAYRGAGRASAAVRLLADWALGELGAEKLVARIHPGHGSSEAVARHAGLERRGPIQPAHDLWVRSAASMPP